MMVVVMLHGMMVVMVVMMRDVMVMMRHPMVFHGLGGRWCRGRLCDRSADQVGGKSCGNHNGF
jgi:hypothetical protein